MADQICIHRREFDPVLQEQIRNECQTRNFIWRDFEQVDLIAREIKMGEQMAKKLLPEPLRAHLQCVVDPFDYHIKFYISVGYE